MNQRSLYITLFVIALVVVGATLIQRQTSTSANKPAVIDFTLNDITGESVKLSAYRGKVVVVDVWATWCGYCVREIPDLIALQQEAIKAKQPLQFIGISVDRDRQVVKTFTREQRINYPILYADPIQMAPFGEITGYPTKFIVNCHGEIVDTIIGSLTKDELESRIRKWLK